MAEDDKTGETHERAPVAFTEHRKTEAAGLRTITSLTRGISISLMAILVAVATIFAVVFYSAERIDQYANRKSVEQVQRLIRLELDKIASLSLEYGWWTEAVQRVIYDRNQAWAEDDGGGYIQRTYDLNWVLSLDRKGKLAHGKHGEETLDALPGPVMTPGLARLVDEATHTDFSNPQPASGIIDLDGTPGLVAVTSYTAYEPTDLETDRSHGALVLIRMLDPALLSSWSDDFQLSQLAFQPKDLQDGDTGTEENNALAIRTTQGERLGQLQWVPETAGRRFLSLMLPWALAGGGTILLFSVVFYCKLRRYSRVAHHHFTELNASRQALTHQAIYDFLTGLPNRSLFIDHLNREISHSVRHGKRAAVVYIDLDGFKSVNDTLGHAVGDELLCRVADELTRHVRQEDVVARFGGDEFCILLTEITDRRDVHAIIEKIHQQFATSFKVGDSLLVVGASIGIVMIPDDTTDCSNVFRFSDIAMYQAKSRGTNGYCFYTDDMEAASRQRISIKSHLSGALERGELYLHYQPIYDLKEHSVAGLEALLRWQSPTLGDVSPADFIPLAEESDLITHLGFWVFDQALTDLGRISRDTGMDLTMSINVSARQLKDHHLPSKLEDIREAHGVEASRVRLEITESLLISQHDPANSVLTDLAEKGYPLVLDDFGTGYSALGYLQRYPLTAIKIDKSFVSGPLVSDPLLVKTIVYMADMAGMTTVAEGIETAEQEQFLCDIGCDFGQGFHFSHPREVAHMISLVKARQFPLPS